MENLFPYDDSIRTVLARECPRVRPILVNARTKVNGLAMQMQNNCEKSSQGHSIGPDDHLVEVGYVLSWVAT